MFFYILSFSFYFSDPATGRPSVPWFPTNTPYVITKRPIPGLLAIQQPDAKINLAPEKPSTVSEELVAVQIKMNVKLMDEVTKLRAESRKASNEISDLREQLNDAHGAIDLLKKEKAALRFKLNTATEKTKYLEKKHRGKENVKPHFSI